MLGHPQGGFLTLRPIPADYFRIICGEKGKCDGASRWHFKERVTGTGGTGLTKSTSYETASRILTARREACALCKPLHHVLQCVRTHEGDVLGIKMSEGGHASRRAPCEVPLPPRLGAS